jgi:hypothetical protein
MVSQTTDCTISVDIGVQNDDGESFIGIEISSLTGDIIIFALARGESPTEIKRLEVGNVLTGEICNTPWTNVLNAIKKE